MDEQGLAAQGMGQRQGMGPRDGSGMGAQGDQQTMAMIQEVMKLLVSGVSPEDIVAQGVPAEIVQMAMDQLNAQGAQQQAQVKQPMEGLAAQGMR